MKKADKSRRWATNEQKNTPALPHKWQSRVAMLANILTEVK
jgi:hypothetical protein